MYHGILSDMHTDADFDALAALLAATAAFAAATAAIALIFNPPYVHVDRLRQASALLRIRTGSMVFPFQSRAPE